MAEVGNTLSTRTNRAMATERIRTFGNVDAGSLSQLERCVGEQGAYGVLCADHHLGYSQPIGGAVAYKDHISPSGVGWDVGCGNKAARTSLRVEDVQVPAVMDEISRQISFGVGRENQEPVDHAVLDEIREAEFAPQQELLDLAARQLGTVGAGNHYVDLFEDESGFLWVGVHFGSRGFGHKTAGGFLALAQGRKFSDRVAEGGMHSPPVLLDTRTELGQAYISAMELAGRYAYAGRDWVVSKVLEILGATSDIEVHNHHNFAWRETHFGEDYWVVRKGCTPAFPGQQGFVGGSMGDISVILEGAESGDSAAALYSTVHGAGRMMSRSEAAGRIKSVYQCNERDCEFWMKPKDYVSELARRGLPRGSGLCPAHPDRGMSKRPVRIKEGVVDWDATRRSLAAQGIELRGGAADEAPDVYKPLPDVLAAHGETIRVLHTLRPVGVAMAGAGTFDPYKD
jgi:tRNA-splicing ligase RtcB (3'-phosphate/5'-hydroxy nucleic acid ligase)